MKGHVEVAELLIRAGCNIEVENKEGFAPKQLTQVLGIKDLYL